MRKIAGFLLVFGSVFVTSANAAISLELTAATAATTVQQSATRPCIYGDPSCSAGALGSYTVFDPNPTGHIYNYTGQAFTGSTQETPQYYTVGQVRSAVGDSFKIGIDVNTTGKTGTETLRSFAVYVGTAMNPYATTLYSFVAPGTTPAVNLGSSILNAGNGYSDWILTGPGGAALSIAGLNSADRLTFTLLETGTEAGREQYFLVASPVPEPHEWMLLLAGLAVVGRAAKARLREVPETSKS